MYRCQVVTSLAITGSVQYDSTSVQTRVVTSHAMTGSVQYSTGVHTRVDTSQLTSLSPSGLGVCSVQSVHAISGSVQYSTGLHTRVDKHS